MDDRGGRAQYDPMASAEAEAQREAVDEARALEEQRASAASDRLVTADEVETAVADPESAASAGTAAELLAEGTGALVAPESGEYVSADIVNLSRASAGRVDARDVSVRMGAVGMARADRVHVQMGAVGAALGNDVRVAKGFARFAAARNTVRLDQSGAVGVLANRVEMGSDSGTVFLIARSVSGNVRTVFDWRAGVAFGVAAGVATAVLSAARRARSGR